LNLEWFSNGSQGFPLGATKNTLALMERNGFKLEYHESGGGHTGESWRDYVHSVSTQAFNHRELRTENWTIGHS
jgi:hypothetical protein